MKIQERINLLFQNTGKTVSGLARLLNTRSSTIDGWIKQGKCPSADSIPIIAEYFNVSTDYLLTGKEYNSNARLDKKFEAMLNSLSDKKLEELYHYLEYLSERPDDK